MMRSSIPRTFFVSLSRGIMMWLGWTCWACSSSVMSVSAFCSVGALASVSFLSLLTSLVTARARGSRSHLPLQRKSARKAIRLTRKPDAASDSAKRAHPPKTAGCLEFKGVLFLGPSSHSLGAYMRTECLDQDLGLLCRPSREHECVCTPPACNFLLLCT